MSLPQQPTNTNARPSWSFRVATVAGIPIRINITFFLFLGWIAFAGSANGGFAWVLFIVSIFLCVLLHELGHALVGQRFGVRTRDITLYPIGGVAMLDNRPTPRQELWIALAGPAVNVVLAILLGIVVYTMEGTSTLLSGHMSKMTMLDALLVANVTLAVFNMIPAFPMDGGRVLRAALAIAMPETQATRIAAGIGQGLALLIIVVGLMAQDFVLVVIAFFVFFGASQEVNATVTRSFIHGHTVTDAMQTNFRTIRSGDSLQTAASMLLEGSQHDFPVTNGDEVIGILMRTGIVQGLSTDGPTAYVASMMQRDFKIAEPAMPLETAMEMFSQVDSTPILVMEEDKLVGMLTMENFSEFVMLEHAKSRRGNGIAS